jgi:putative tryptophan/tyrosine transport system substrate-binding protein
MQRREFITLLGGAAATWPLGARAAGPVRLIGVLMYSPESDPTTQPLVAAFRGTLSKLGWTEGSNVRIELRWGKGDDDRTKTLAKELVDLRPDAIFGMGTRVIGALAQETRTIPIVFVVVSDPIGSGFAANIAHPGGNITGFTDNDSAMGGKWVELLKEIAYASTHQPFTYKDPCVEIGPHVGYDATATEAAKVSVKDILNAVFALQLVGR